ncbi:hypothetical protein E2C01_040166 [Portunus trituberculatus]|uniref:Uncharacterized protein n=1 Tax=Portunus trituberculatus TaxID=210409 RepID=A0A5B7FLT8_PORTR|nr:hypothetical protein [Portunus trituberculatus]
MMELLPLFKPAYIAECLGIFSCTALLGTARFLLFLLLLHTPQVRFFEMDGKDSTILVFFSLSRGLPFIVCLPYPSSRFSLPPPPLPPPKPIPATSSTRPCNRSTPVLWPSIQFIPSHKPSPRSDMAINTAHNQPQRWKITLEKQEKTRGTEEVEKWGNKKSDFGSGEKGEAMTGRAGILGKMRSHFRMGKEDEEDV